MDLYIHEHLTFCIYDIITNDIGKKEYTTVSQKVKIYTYYSINKQCVDGLQKWKKFTWWWGKVKSPCGFNINMSPVQRTEAKRGWEWVFETILWHHTKHPKDTPIL